MRALIVGLFALVLVTQAAAAAFGGNPSGTSKTTPSTKNPTTTGTASSSLPLSLDEQLRRGLAEQRRYRGTIRFFEIHPGLLRSGSQRAKALATLRDARRQLARLGPSIARLHKAIARRDSRRLAAQPPRKAICSVFHDYCREAVAVAWCESRLHTTARNGQYLGLFQMGDTARRLYGHGPSAYEQAIAAHRYFVDSGRDWSPWSCRWAAS